MNKLKIVVAGMLLGSFVCAEEKSVDLTQMQEFYYNKGYQVAAEKFYRMGYEKAIANATKALSKYKNEIDSFEAGKYLSEKGKLTIPKIYRLKNSDGSYLVKVLPPEVKEPLSYSDILRLPEYEAMADIDSVKIDEISNAFHSLADNTQNITSANTDLRAFDIAFPKNDKVRNVLTKNNRVITETPDGYKVTFSNKTDYETFCKTTTGSESCEPLFKVQ